MTIYSKLSPVFLVIAALALPLLVSVEALTKRPGAISMEASSIQQRKLSHKRDSVAFVVSAPRGGEANDDSKGGVETEADNEEDETEVEEEIVEAAADEIEVEVEELVEEVVEEAVEELVEEMVEEVDVAEEEEEVDAAEVDEEEVEVVFPTDEIPSDDVRSFHTTDGELADDEGVYTDGQNESPIADNEAAEDTIGGTEEPADGVDDDDEEEVEDGESAFAEATAVRAGASVAIIDEELKKVLITELRYTEEDVANMRPEIAQEVVDNKLAKPTEGMPKNWYSNPELANKEESLLAKKKGLIASVAIIGAVALSVGVLKENDSIGDTVEEIVDALKSIPKAIVAFVVAAKKNVTGGIPKKKEAAPVPAATITEPEEEKIEDAPEPKDVSVHSIKPGTAASEVPDPDVDTTWLDKTLTRIGGVFKSFMNAKI